MIGTNPNLTKKRSVQTLYQHPEGDWMRWLVGTADSMAMNLGKPGDGEGQEGLVCCSPWGRKESDVT